MYEGPIEIGMKFKQDYTPENPNIKFRNIKFRIATITFIEKAIKESNYRIYYNEARHYSDGNENSVPNSWRAENFRAVYSPYIPEQKIISKKLLPGWVKFEIPGVVNGFPNNVHANELWMCTGKGHRGYKAIFGEPITFKGACQVCVDKGYVKVYEDSTSSVETPVATNKMPEVIKPKTIGSYISDAQHEKFLLETNVSYHAWNAQQKGLNLKVIPSEYKKPEYKPDPIYPCDNYLDPEWVPNTDLYGKNKI